MNKDCPFCLDNGLLRNPVIAESAGALLIDNLQFPGCYLVVPRPHIESVTELPDMWWADFKQMFDRIEQLPENYNLTLNIGSAAGQTVKHLHFWVVPRSEEGPAVGKGLATLVRDFTVQE